MSIGFGPTQDVGDTSRLSSQVERDSSPINIVNKASLSIVSDTLELNLTNIGEKNLWKYLSSESQPTLSHPLVSMLVVPSRSDIQDKAWEAYYDNIKELLDKSVGERLQEELKKASNEQSPSYVALNDVLLTTAKALAWLDGAVQGNDPMGKIAKEALINSMMATVASDNLVREGKEFIKGAMRFLDNVGANYIHYDKLSNNLKQMDDGLNGMQTLIKNK